MNKNIIRRIVGIDLGTTNSVVSEVINNVAKAIENTDGSKINPSVTAYVEENNKNDNSKTVVIRIGDMAKRQAHLNPKHTFNVIKRIMGKKYDDVKHLMKSTSYDIVADDKGNAAVSIFGKVVSPVEVTAQYLKRLVANTAGVTGKVDAVVITVPAHFDDAQRNAVKAAGEIAGLVVERIINEPTAAALAYGFEKITSGKILVYDFGGGTFDVTVLSVDDGIFQVLSTGGDANLGGEDIDNMLLELVVADFQAKNNIDLRTNATALYRVKEECKNAKHQLSHSKVVVISVPFVTAVGSEPKHIEYELRIEKFNDMIANIVNKTFKITDSVIKEANMKYSELNEIVLVGGSTRLLCVEEGIEKHTGKKASKNINVDEVVSYGAAIQGAVLSGAVSDIVLLDVTPLSLGIESVGGVVAKIIEANTKIPKKATKIFTTSSDNQTVASIAIYQGNRPQVQHCKKLGYFELTGLKPAPRGTLQIEVTFSIDSNGILSVEAIEKSSGNKQSVVLKNDGISKDEISKMQKEAEDQMDADKEFVKQAESISEFQMIHSDLSKKIDEVVKINDVKGKEFKDQLDACDALMKENNVNKALEDVRTLAQNIAQFTQENQSAKSEEKPADNNDGDKSPESPQEPSSESEEK